MLTSFHRLVSTIVQICQGITSSLSFDYTVFFKTFEGNCSSNDRVYNKMPLAPMISFCFGNLMYRAP